MAEAIYKLYLVKGNDAWYQLSPEERDRLTARVGESFESVGGKLIITCDTSWSSEPWMFFGVEEYPDIEAAQKHAQNLGEMDWFRYVESMSVLGTKASR